MISIYISVQFVIKLKCYAAINVGSKSNAEQWKVTVKVYVDLKVFLAPTEENHFLKMAALSNAKGKISTATRSSVGSAA